MSHTATGILYLIHFEAKVGGHAQHYLGYTADLPARIQAHRAGNGSALMAEVTRLGLRWKVVRTWKGTRADERKLKQRKKHRKLCPVCNPVGWATNAPDR